MKRLVLSKGCSRRGAQMGRADVIPDNIKGPLKLHLERLRLDNGGYDKWGAYFGFPDNLYCAYAWHNYPQFDCLIFVRANKRFWAKFLVRRELKFRDKVSFYR